jgi:sulfite exporter TauE/SafE
MLSSIHPLGERARGQRWTTTVVAYAIGSTAGGVIAGGTAGLGGSVAYTAGLTPRGAAATAAVASIVVAVLETARRGRAWPGPRRQVNEDWLVEFRGWVYGAGFGLQLGLGVATIVTTATVHLMLAAAALTGSAALGALVGAAFGLGRAAPVLAARRIRDQEALRAFHRRLDALGAPAASASVGVMLVVGAGLAAAWVAGA